MFGPSDLECWIVMAIAAVLIAIFGSAITLFILYLANHISIGFH